MVACRAWHLRCMMSFSLHDYASASGSQLCIMDQNEETVTLPSPVPGSLLSLSVPHPSLSLSASSFFSCLLFLNSPSYCWFTSQFLLLLHATIFLRHFSPLHSSTPSFLCVLPFPLLSPLFHLLSLQRWRTNRSYYSCKKWTSSLNSRKRLYLGTVPEWERGHRKRLAPLNESPHPNFNPHQLHITHSPSS